MTHISTSDGVFWARDVSPSDASGLIELGWRRHDRDLQIWWTRSPYLAAPLWRNGDDGARAALQPYAWNYETSFARSPLGGTGIDAIRLPAGSDPYPFQVAGVQRGMMRKKMLIGDQPGLGKTVQALAMMNLIRPKRTIIGCPTFLTENWAAECDRWCVDPQPIAILNGAKKNIPESGITIVPYSRGHNFSDAIKAGPPIDFCILDEPHYLKEPNARRTKPWLGPGGLARVADRCVGLTGTPIPNNPLEIYGLIDVFAPELLSGLSRDKFKSLYCSVATLPMKRRDEFGAEKPVEKITAKATSCLNAELRASGLMVRRLKSDVLTQLPPKNVYFVHMTPDSEIEALVKEEASLFEQLHMRILPSQELMTIRGHVSTVRARLGLLKAPKIAEYLRWIFEQGEDRVVCFMLHIEAIEAIRAAFGHSGIETLVLTGAESPKMRQARVDRFQSPGGRRLIVAQMTAAGEGLTMTTARYCVLGEINWTPTRNEQAIDRVHRITQTRQVEAPVICFPHGVEEKVVRTNARKQIDAHEILDVNLQRLAS